VVRLDFAGYGNKFKLRLRQYKNLFSSDLTVNFVRASGELERHTIDQTKWFTGNLVGKDTEGSSARVHIAEDGLRATIKVADEVYRIEPLNRSETRQARASAEFNHVVYAHRNVRSEESDHGTCGFEEHLHGDESVHRHARSAPSTTGEDKLEPETESRGRRAASTQEWSAGTPVEPIRNVCQMHLVSDHHFFRAKGSIQAASDAMIEFLADVNSNYRNTAFDASISESDVHMYTHRLQFAVGQITVFESNEDLKDSNDEIRIEYPWSADTTSSNQFLNEFSFRNGKSSQGVSDLISKNKDSICLSHAFTKQDFDGGTLGLAWLGTVCGASSAAGITTIINYDNDVPYTQNQLVVAHELGHNLGMNHDGYAQASQASTSTFCNDYCRTSLAQSDSNCDAAPSGGGTECCSTDDKVYVGQYSLGGRYAMWPTSVDGGDSNNLKFSPCSRFLANNRIVGQSRDSCFVKPEVSICGNGIVEFGEDCDCGITNTDVTDPTQLASILSYCQTAEDNYNKDPCCLPNCTLDSANEGKRPDGPAECSAKKGDCCGENVGERCKLLGFDKNTDFDDYANSLLPKTSSIAANGEEFRCRLGEDCTETAYCVNDPEFGGVCPITFYEKQTVAAELVLDATVAANKDSTAAQAALDNWELQKHRAYKPDKVTVCAENSRTCVAGECSGDLCASFKHNGGVPTKCDLGVFSQACEIACDFDIDGGCNSTVGFDFTTLVGLSTTIATNGSQKAAGSICGGAVSTNLISGFCTEAGACETPSTTSPTDLLLLLNAAWVWDNWYWVLVFEAGVAGLAFLMRCGEAKRMVATKNFVKSRLRGSQFTKSVKERAFKKTIKLKGGRQQAGSTSTDTNKSKRNSIWREMAVLEAEGEHLRRTSMKYGGKKKADMAFFRLRVLFPFAKEDVLRAMIKVSPHEECAVARLLVLGHNMWEVTDYKTLQFAAKAHKKQGVVQRRGKGAGK
jgi:hypothetical protein